MPIERGAGDSQRISSRNSYVVVLRVSNVEDGDMKKKKRDKTLCDSIVKRVHSGTLIAKQMKSGSIKLVVFKEPENFFIVLNNIFPSVVHEEPADITINVDNSLHDLTDLTEKRLLKPLAITNKEQLKLETAKLMNVFDAVAKSSAEQSNINKLETSLIRLAKTVCKGESVKVFVFGSRKTGLAREGSDVDIYLDAGGSFKGSICDSEERQKEMVELFEDQMNRKTGFDVKSAITNTAVPILKFRHVETGLNCDLSFRSGMAVMNSELVKLYLNLDPRVKFVVTGIRVWMEKNGLADKNMFSSYAQIWLALFFLMQEDIGVIPSVEELRKLAPSTPLTIEGWNCAVPNGEEVKWKKSTCRLSREELLDEFFVFYSRIPLEKVLLCPFTGRVERRKRFFRKNRFRKFFAEYGKKTDSETLSAFVCQKIYAGGEFSGFCVQDPLDQLKNLTKYLTRNNCRKAAEFIEYCKQFACC